ncbi:Hsp70 family protein [Ferruginibacter yonginensis]|uniref:Hsp70 family protein n=1 Tax=Ferruginibacter yonginensis TaxID=1310416 RepID=A0ABV8QP68_9BACT
MKPVNFGIDLGTTNSLIAKYEHNKVRVYKNPIGLKETLPSVVAFRKDRTLIGEKAREYLTKDAVNVFGGFKRKMGTDEKYYVVNLDENVTPIELSTMVLKELKNFVQEQEPMEACVITIPASFDSMQSNATLQAGKAAGFKEVFLLQEPIAASLAYFNANGSSDVKNDGYRLVYDFGGGTFDVALVKSTQDDLKVIDHEGNNFLGGMDLDFAIIEKIIVPAIVQQTQIDNFEEDFRTKFGKYESLYYQVLYYAEEAKKELSNSNKTEIEFSATLNDVAYDFYIPITRQQIDDIFAPIIQETIQLIQKILVNNELVATDINEIILVGGSTYLPQVREQLAAQTGIAINYSIDPTTSIAVGAAYYAANKYYEPSAILSSETTEQKAGSIADDLLATVDFNDTDIEMVLSYNKSTRDKEEVLIMQCNGAYENCTYRIYRADGGFDTGHVPLKAKKTEFLPLLAENVNIFNLQIFDAAQNEIKRLSQQLQIAQGIYNIDGQPLPHDICIEVDDVENKTTKLEVVFERNSLLPQKRTLYREISKTIKKGADDSIIINILEGDKSSRASSNLTIGCINISGKDLQSDLIKGSDIEIQIHITDSRILNTVVYLVMTQQEFKNVFSISEKQISVARLKEQYILLENEISDNIREFQYNEDKIWEINANTYLEELQSLQPRLFKLKDNDASDDKYIIAEKMARISQNADKLGGNERIAGLLETYLQRKEETAALIAAADFEKDELLKQLQKLEQSEASFMRSKNASVIEGKLRQLHDLYWKGLSNTTSFLISIFIEYKSYEPIAFKDYNAAKSIFKMADAALTSERYPEFRRHVFSLSNLLKRSDLNTHIDFKGTGIG